MLRAVLLFLLPLAAVADQSSAPLMGWKAGPVGQAPRGVPNAVVAMPPSVDYALLVDLNKARTYLLENTDGTPRVLRHMYSSIGKNGAGKQLQGDGRTPVGIYRVTSYIDDPDLPELYGNGAYPVDYPNAWDIAADRTGYGIWVHGVPRDTDNRPPRSSEGCVTVANVDLDGLAPFIDIGSTPVIFSDKLDWIDVDEQAAFRSRMLDRLGAWETAWEALDTEAYLAFYAEDFSAGGLDRTAFAEHKRRVNAGKSYVELELEDVGVYRYPDGDNVVLIEFEQHYESDNYRSSGRKQQFWRLDDDHGWLIVQEHSPD